MNLIKIGIITIVIVGIISLSPVFVDAQSYSYDYWRSTLKFDKNLNNLSCDHVLIDVKIDTASSLNIDEMDNYFFIILGKTNSENYHYLQISLPDDNGIDGRESYLLDFANEDTQVRGEYFTTDYDHLAIFLQTSSGAYKVKTDNYKEFLTGQSTHVSSSITSLGPGEYDLHAILFQSDSTSWLKNEVCAISLNWPVSVGNGGSITPHEPQTQIGRMYPFETNHDRVAEIEAMKAIDEEKQRNKRVQLEDSLNIQASFDKITQHTIIDKPDIHDGSKIKKVHISPLKQKMSGILPEDIICKEGLEKIFKHVDSVACVTPLTAEKLIQRGWISSSIELQDKAIIIQKLVELLESEKISEFNELRSKSERHLILQYVNAEGLDLTGINLEYLYLARVNLHDANLQDANLYYSTFSVVDLEGTDFQGSNLQGINLQGEKLGKVNLENVNLQDADLRNTNLVSANLQGTHLQDAILSNANLQDANLQNANLKYAKINAVNLRGTNLQGANLQDADLQGSIMIDANLQDANLDNTNLKSTNLSSVKNLPITIGEARARGAIINEN